MAKRKLKISYVKKNEACSLVERIKSTHWSQEIESSHWSRENKPIRNYNGINQIERKELLLVKRKWRVLISEEKIEKSHWSRENWELSLVDRKFRVLIGREKIKSSHWSRENKPIRNYNGINHIGQNTYLLIYRW